MEGWIDWTGSKYYLGEQKKYYSNERGIDGRSGRQELSERTKDGWNGWNGREVPFERTNDGRKEGGADGWMAWAPRTICTNKGWMCAGRDGKIDMVWQWNQERPQITFIIALPFVSPISFPRLPFTCFAISLLNLISFLASEFTLLFSTHAAFGSSLDCPFLSFSPLTFLNFLL